jgi:hypothetical protein
MSEEPEQDRRRRRLLWLLLFLAGTTAALAAGVGIGTLVFHRSPGSPRHHVTASGVGFASDRSGPGSGHLHPSPSPSPSTTDAPATTPPATTTTTTSAEASGITHVIATGGHPAGWLTVSAVVTGQLSPGRPHALVVTIGNPGAHAVRVTAVNVAVGQPSVSGCLPGWFASTGGPGSHLVIRAGSTGQATLQLRLRNLPHRNQDACKSVHIPLKVNVTAVEVPL